MRFFTTIAAVAVLVLPAAGAECLWQAEDGSQIETVHLKDYSYALQAAGKWGTLCAVVRSPEQTTLTCDDGSEYALSLADDGNGSSSVVLSDKVYAPVCQ